MIGTTISRYTIHEKLGEGGMGVVYKAEDTKLKRTVALKFLPKELTRDQEARERFELEAQAAASLNNPNIVTIHEIDEHEGHIYIAMEYVEGETLRDKLPAIWARHDTPYEETDPFKTQKLPSTPIIPPPEQQLKPREVIDIAIQVCEGLKATHKLGIVHRDIKPQNIIINNDGIVKILDFGVAKLTRDTNVSKEYSTMGTVHYMSPDQLTGKIVDRRTDIWSLGVVLYELLTVSLPFKEDNMQAIMYSIINKNPLPPSEINENVPRGLERIVLRCLRKDPEERYQSVDPLLLDLKKLVKSMQKDSQELKLKRKTAKKETERRNATVISAEIGGYREMLETMDAEEVAAAVSEYFDMFTTVANKYEGRLDKVSESRFMVFFGVPSAVENGPVKAINAAIGMRVGLEQFKRKQRIDAPLDCRMGIDTGTVIVGVMGKEEEKYSVIGDPVNTANQLRETAGENCILVGSQAQKTTREYFEYKELKALPSKGKKAASSYFELLSLVEKSPQQRLGTERMIHAEMVGREKELDKLRLHLMKVINGEGSIINVIGEAGIGKSRLLGEFKKKEDLKRVTFLSGRALSIGKNLSFHPVIGLMKNWMGVEDNDSPQQLFLKLESSIKKLFPDAAQEIFPFIATLMGIKLTDKYAARIRDIGGDALDRLIKKNFRELVQRIAEIKPVVFLIEDLHWADMSSIELLESLSRLVKDMPILFINVFRPGSKETGERLLTTVKERYPGLHTEIVLGSLDESHSKQLIAGLLDVKGLPGNVVSIITRKAGGNPFFIEEVMRSFIDDGVVEHKNGHFKVTEKIDSVVIPETINDVLMGRIDKLDEATRSLLKVASVIGRHFFYKVLVEVADDIADIDEKLEFLKESQLIDERRRMAEVEYIFKHALVQEVAYESLLLKKRKELHSRVADAIESIFAGQLREFYGMLALHYSLGENLEKAEDYLVKAGEEALKAAASSEALNYYQEALKLYLKKHGKAGDPDTIADLEKNIATAFYNKGFMTETVEHCNKALALWGEKLPKTKLGETVKLGINLLTILKGLYISSPKKKKDPGPRGNDIFDITITRGSALSTVDNYKMFVNSMGILSRLHKLDLSKINKGASMYIQGSLLFSFFGLFGISKKLLESPREYITGGGIRGVVDYKSGQMMYGFFSGEWSKDTDYNQEVVDNCLRLGELFTVQVYLLWSGVLQLEQGRLDGTRKCEDHLKTIGEVYENDYSLTILYLVLSRRLLKTRKLNEAVEAAEAGIALAGSIDQTLMLFNATGIKANAQLLLGDLDGAQKTLDQAEEIASREKWIAPWHYSSFRLSTFLLHLLSLKKAIAENDSAKISEFTKKAAKSGNIAVKISANYAPNRTETYRLMGLYHWYLGKRKKAFDWFAKSVAMGEKMGARIELARTYTEVAAKLYQDNGQFKELNGLSATGCQEKARKIFTELGLESDQPF